MKFHIHIYQDGEILRETSFVVYKHVTFVDMLVMGLVLGPNLMVISTMGILL